MRYCCFSRRALLYGISTKYCGSDQGSHHIYDGETRFDPQLCGVSTCGNIGETEPQPLVPNYTSCFDSTFRYTPRNTVRDVLCHFPGRFVHSIPAPSVAFLSVWVATQIALE